MTIRLIVNADDFGLTEGVNRSIIACHRAGTVTSTTLMTNMGAAEDAARLARENPELAVGLHFNLTTGRPLSDARLVPSLVGPDGEFVNRGELARRAMMGKLSRAEVRTELDAQLQRMHALGLRPTHFDSHQHVHVVPQVFAELSRAAAAQNVPIRLPWSWPGHAAGKSLRRRASEHLMQAMTWRCRAVTPRGVRSNDGLCSVFDLPVEADELCFAAYEKLLDAYRDGVVELMVHPAQVDDELKSRTQITEVSAMEDQLLRSGFLRDYVQRRNGRLATYRDLS